MCGTHLIGSDEIESSERELSKLRTAFETKITDEDEAGSQTPVEAVADSECPSTWTEFESTDIDKGSETKQPGQSDSQEHGLLADIHCPPATWTTFESTDFDEGSETSARI